jgi:hypothetical protein
MEANITKTHSRLSFFSKSSKLKWIVAFMLFLPIVFSAQKSHATHMMGADITYRCIEPLKFEITLKWYRDCRGVALHGGGGLTIRCTSGGNNYTGTITLIR